MIAEVNIQENQNYKVYNVFNSDSRCGVSAGRSRGGWDGTSAGHHAKRGRPVDAQARPAAV